MRARRPATVVLDLMMPVMDGFTFIETCHKEQLCDGVPIVVISAIQDALRRIVEVPVHACMAKPFDLDELVRVVGQHARTSTNGHLTGESSPSSPA
jgi:DNA-binding response OmpR family regulator